MAAFLAFSLFALMLAASLGVAWTRVRSQTRGPIDPVMPTAELYTDPSSGSTSRVWIDRVTGDRHYIPEA